MTHISIMPVVIAMEILLCAIVMNYFSKGRSPFESCMSCYSGGLIIEEA